MISGFCNPGNPEDSHHRCRMSSCACALFADHHNPRVTVAADTGIRVTLNGQIDTMVVPPGGPFDQRIVPYLTQPHPSLAQLAQAVATARLNLPRPDDRTDYARGRHDAYTEVVNWIMYGTPVPPPPPTLEEPA